MSRLLSFIAHFGMFNRDRRVILVGVDVDSNSVECHHLSHFVGKQEIGSTDLKKLQRQVIDTLRSEEKRYPQFFLCWLFALNLLFSSNHQDSFILPYLAIALITVSIWNEHDAKETRTSEWAKKMDQVSQELGGEIRIPPEGRIQQWRKQQGNAPKPLISEPDVALQHSSTETPSRKRAPKEASLESELQNQQQEVQNLKKLIDKLRTKNEQLSRENKRLREQIKEATSVPTQNSVQTAAFTQDLSPASKPVETIPYNVAEGYIRVLRQQLDQETKTNERYKMEIEQLKLNLEKAKGESVENYARMTKMLDASKM